MYNKNTYEDNMKVKFVTLYPLTCHLWNGNKSLYFLHVCLQTLMHF